MSSLYEFYQEKEIRELTNTINSAKYISEDQKETMIGILSEDWASDRKDAADREQDPHRLQAKKGEQQRAKDAEYKEKQKKRKEKMSQADRDWADDRAAAAQAAG